MFLGINQLISVRSLITIKGYNSFEYYKYEAAIVASIFFLPITFKISSKSILLLGAIKIGAKVANLLKILFNS